MKKILIIGIGAGDPDYLTIQAVKALNRVDVFFIMDKGPEKAKLSALREQICRQHISSHDYRVVEAVSPEWVRGSTADYGSTIDALNQDKQAIFERLIADDMAEGECAGFLVWGDPALYDSTLRIIETIDRSGRHNLEYEVIPGISSVQALAAKHRTALNRVGKSVGITTGRKIAAQFPDEFDSVVVMLDAGDSYRRYAGQDIDIYWGAYVGTPDEILISGKLCDVADDIASARAAAREANGWIMDSYLMRRRE